MVVFSAYDYAVRNICTSYRKLKEFIYFHKRHPAFPDQAFTHRRERSTWRVCAVATVV